MVKTKVTMDESQTIELCETYSDENWCLLQVETDITYGSHVIDVIAGFNDDGTPYSKYTYIETDKKDEEQN